MTDAAEVGILHRTAGTGRSWPTIAASYRVIDFKAGQILQSTWYMPGVARAGLSC